MPLPQSIQSEIETYLERIKQAQSEDARLHRFSLLLDRLFNIGYEDINEYLNRINYTMKGRLHGTIVRRHPDSLFGNVVLEFEYDLRKKSEVEEAERQLKEYLTILSQNERNYAYIGIATDGVRFRVYNLVDGQLKMIEEIDFEKASVEDIYFFLDHYFMRREIRPLTTEYVLKDLGLNSPAYQRLSALLSRLLNEYGSRPDVEVLFSEWKRYISIAYGDDVSSGELFVRHTYLSIILKLIIAAILNRLSASWREIIGGEVFRQEGIENLFEEDFFTWILRYDMLEQMDEELRKIRSIIESYDLSGVKEDVLKELYQELIDPTTRHDLGEYYTPDWLAHMMVKEVLEENPDVSILDPACGSGSFLYFSILEKKEAGKTLNEILSQVMGIDIHPLAVLTAKTNYLMAIKDLIGKHRGKIFIPIYLADSLKIPEGMGALFGNYLEADVYDRKVQIPQKVFNESGLFDDILSEIGKLLNMDTPLNERAFMNKFKRIAPSLDDSDLKFLYARFYMVLKQLKDEGRDSIWIFILSNIFRPIVLKGNFDVVIGNPPWIALRYIKNQDYQEEIKRMVSKVYKLETRGKNITHIEVAILFILESLNRFIRNDGYVFFVVPRSIYSASHHKGFRSGNLALFNIRVEEVWDLENVKPLFNVPAAVVKVRKGDMEYPIPAKVFRGTLPRRNSGLEEAISRLTIEIAQIYLHATQRNLESAWDYHEPIIEYKKSPYHSKFYQGATIVPKNLFFVEVERELDTTYLLKQAEGIDYKAPYTHTFRDIFGRDYIEIEKQFVFDIITGSDVVPFGIVRIRKVILPLLVSSRGALRLIRKEEALERGYTYLYEFLKKAEDYWNTYSKKKKMDIYERLDYPSGKGLSRQVIHSERLKVVYPTSGTYLASGMVDGRLLIDTKLYYYNSKDLNEVLYLSGILNSPYLDNLKTRFQSKGQLGPRDIHKKPLQIVPIPHFDEKNPLHMELVELSGHLHEKVRKIIDKNPQFRKTTRIGTVRAKIRELIEDELKMLDDIVIRILREQ